MPRAYDKFPNQRTAADHNPLANLLNWQDVTAQSAQGAAAAINNGITTGSQQAADASSNDTATYLSQLWINAQAVINGVVGGVDSDVSDFVAALQATAGDASDAVAKWQSVLDDLGLNFIDLSAWFKTSASGAFATNISSSVITDSAAQLLPNPNFSGAISIAGNNIWDWDDTVYFIPPGQVVTDPGSAKVAANGAMQVLESIATAGPLPLGQPIDYSVKVLALGLTGSGNLIQLLAIPWIGDTPQTPITIQQIGAPAGATTGWTNPPSGSTAAILSGSYTPLTTSGVTSVSMAVTVTDSATGGTVWFSAASEELTGGLIADLQNDESARSQAWATLWESWWTTLSNGSLSFSAKLAAMETALATYQATNADINLSESATISQLLNSLLPFNTSTGQLVQEGVEGLTDLWQAWTGTPTPTPTTKITPASITQALNQGSVEADLQALGSLFFGSHTVGTAVSASALPNIAAGTGGGQSADLLTHLTAVSAAAGTTGATPVAAATAGMQLITNTLSDVAASLQQQNTGSTGAGNSGQSFFLDFAAYSTWSAVPVNTTYGAIPGASSYGTGTFEINSSGDAAWNAVNNGDVSGMCIYNGAGGQAFTNTDYQRLNASLAGLPNGVNSKNYCTMRANAITNPSDYVYGVVYLNSSFQLIWEIGCYISGTQHTWATGTDATLNLNFTMIAGVGNNPNRYQGYSGNTLVFDHTNVSGDPGGLFPVGSTHRYWGFRSDTANNGQVSPAPAAYVGMADNQPPTVPGSGIRTYRTGGSQSMTTTTSGTGLNIFPSATFFDTVVENSPDMTQVTGSGEPIIQVANAGRYIVSIRSDVSAVTTGAAAITLCAAVSRVNSAGLLQETRIFPCPAIFINGVGAQYDSASFGGTEVIACEAGDQLIAQYHLAQGPAGTGNLSSLSFTGESTGSHTYFEVTLANWSLN